MAQRKVLVEVYSWVTPREGEAGKYDYHSATKGEIIDLTDKEIERGEGLGALGDVDASDLEQPGQSNLSDEELGAMSAEQLVAYANQNPDEVDHILDLEEARNNPRKTVLALGE